MEGMEPPNYRSNGRAGARESCDICDSYRTGMNGLATCARYEVLVLLTSVCDRFNLRKAMGLIDTAAVEKVAGRVRPIVERTIAALDHVEAELANIT